MSPAKIVPSGLELPAIKSGVLISQREERVHYIVTEGEICRR